MINEKLLNNNIKNKDIITANMSADVTRSATGDYVVTSLTKQAQVGTGFTISDGNIIIGKNISKVLVSATCSMVATTSSNPATRNLGVRKNNVNMKGASTKSVGDWVFISVTDFVVEVKEGDAIGLQMYSQNRDIIKGGSAYTYITIKAVEYNN